jgi:mannose-6-phosphate isomerase-like protein (cupin superfamily)
MQKISLSHKFNLVEEHWRPKVVAALNGQELKIAKVHGVFPWHHHEGEDEMFMVWQGTMRVEFRSHTVELHAGELCVVPRGVEHRTAADEEAWILIFEPAGVLNTGNVHDDVYTAPIGAKI